MLNTHKRIKVFCWIYSSIGFTKMGGIYIVHVMCLTRWWMQLLDTTKKQSDWPGSWFNLMFESILDPWNHQAVDISGETIIFNSYFTNSRKFRPFGDDSLNPMPMIDGFDHDVRSL